MPAGGYFNVRPDHVRSQAPAIERLADAAREAHDGLESMGASSGAFGHAGAAGAFSAMVDAWRGAANQFASSIHGLAQTTGVAADRYMESDQESVAVQTPERPSPDPFIQGP